MSGRAQIGQEGADVHGDAGRGAVDVTGMGRWRGGEGKQHREPVDAEPSKLEALEGARYRQASAVR